MTDNADTEEAARPVVFLSYAWTTPTYRRRVLALAARLESDGAHTVTDATDLHPGDDVDHYMERMVNDPDVDKVILVCNPEYKRKADAREGGVGTESQIVSGEVYRQGTDPERRRKFVAVVMDRGDDGTAPTPTYYGSRRYLDLSDEEIAEDEYAELVNFVHGNPPRPRPTPGPAPADVVAPSARSLGTSTRQSRAVRALRAGDASATAALTDYFDTFASNLVAFEITLEDHPESGDGADVGQLVYDRAEELKPYRDEAVAVFEAVAAFKPDAESIDVVRRFFERLAARFEPAPRATERAGTRAFDWETDPFKLLWEELFLYAVAALLDRERYGAVERLTGAGYLFAQRGQRTVRPFWALQRGATALHHHYGRDGARPAVPMKLWLEGRADHPRIGYDDLVEADLVLFLNHHIRSGEPEVAGSRKRQERGRWYPNTSTGWERTYEPTPFFLRAGADLRAALPALGAEDEAGTRELFGRIEREELTAPAVNHWTISFGTITNAKRIAESA